jgi:hypothetical protein
MALKKNNTIPINPFASKQNETQATVLHEDTYKKTEANKDTIKNKIVISEPKKIISKFSEFANFGGKNVSLDVGKK